MRPILIQILTLLTFCFLVYAGGSMLSEASSPSELLHVFVDGKFGFVSLDGSEIVPARFDHIWGFSQGLCAVEVGGVWGYIGSSGAFVSTNRYDRAEGHSDGRALVARDRMFGYIDLTGREAIPLRFAHASSFNSGVAPVAIVAGGSLKYGVINLSGEYVVEPQYAYVGSFSEGVAIYRVGREWGLLGVDGAQLIKAVYSHEPGNFSDGLFPLEGDDGQWGYMNLRGEYVIPPSFDYAWSFGEGLGCVQVNGLRGFVDVSGNVIIPPIFEGAAFFSEGLAAMSTNELYGYIGMDGSWAIPPSYLEASSFKRGLARVKTIFGWQYIDVRGKTIVQEGLRKKPSGARAIMVSPQESTIALPATQTNIPTD